MPPASAPLLEDILIYVGQILCLASCYFVWAKGYKSAAIILLSAFILQFQSGYVIRFGNIDYEGQGACWAIKNSYYQCLPLLHKVTIHLAQVGTVLLAFGIYLLVNSQRNKNG